MFDLVTYDGMDSSLSSQDCCEFPKNGSFESSCSSGKIIGGGGGDLHSVQVNVICGLVSLRALIQQVVLEILQAKIRKNMSIPLLFLMNCAHQFSVVVRITIVDDFS